MNKCIVCNQELEIGKSHKCPAKVEAVWQARQTKANNETFLDYTDTPRLSENIRLCAGLAMLERQL